jgi:hypothetical protein
MWNISLGEISYPKDRNLMFHLLNERRAAERRTRLAARRGEPDGEGRA